MKTYKVDVYNTGSKFWFLNGELHREDGPACEWADGSKAWFLNGKELTEAEFNARTKPKPSCEGKVVEVDGVKYKLVKAWYSIKTHSFFNHENQIHSKHCSHS